MRLQPVLCILTGYVVVGVVEGNNNPIPYSWEGMCASRSDPEILKSYVDNVLPSDHIIRIQCHVTGNNEVSWRFQTLRDWLRDIRGISVFLQVRCSNGGQISLPWPMKANGLVGLTVSNCILTEKYADFGNQDISQIPDQLRVLEIRNSVWLSERSGFDRITNHGGLANLTSDYDCGQDSTIEYLVSNNVSDVLPPEQLETTTHSITEMKFAGEFNVDLKNAIGGKSDSVSDSSEVQLNNHYQDNEWSDFDLDISDPGGNIHSLTELIASSMLNSNATFDSNTIKAAQDNFMNLLQSLESLDLKCDYEKLRVLDESYPKLLPVQHFSLMVQGARYPELRVMNYSRSGIKKLPHELQDFRIYFPKLQYLDLSRNYLTEIRLTSPFKEASEDRLTLDVRNNLITNISVDDLVSWSQNQDVFVDIRDNPIHCGCEIMHLLQKIQSETFFVGNLWQYRYIRELQCDSPPQLKGQKLSNVSLRCSTTINFAAVSTTSDVSIIPSGETKEFITEYSFTIAAIVFAVVMIVVVVNSLSSEETQEGTTQEGTNVDSLKFTSGRDAEICLIGVEDLHTQV